jgi:16S rRNA (adenine1518-N6/adenine1519-N6)-dimethyltransferase
VGRLTVVELDDDLAEALRVRYADRLDVEVVHGDILDVPLARHCSDPARLKVIGNIPYNITTPIVFSLLVRPRPAEIVIMVQDEVADRIVAAVGTKAYGALSIGVRSVARAERLFKVGRQAFRPVPSVDSAILRITPLRPEPMGPEQEDRLRRLVRACFQWRRKQLGKILRDHADLAYDPAVIEHAAAAVAISLQDRPERLAPQTFLALAGALP